MYNVPEVKNMIECMGDVMSLLCLVSFPALMIIMFFVSLLKKRRTKLIANREQYYREW